MTLILCALGAFIIAGLYLRSKIDVFVRDLLQTARNYFVAIVLFSILIYSCYGVSAIYDAKALGLSLSVSFLLLSYTTGSLITVLPISISGIGTRDLSFIFLMKIAEIPSEKALALSSIGFIFIPCISLFVLYVAALIGAIYEDRHNY